MNDDIAFATATELVRRFRGKSLSPVEALDAALRQLDKIEPTLNAFRVVDCDGARVAAKESESRWHQGEPLSALDGVPVTIKDNLLTRGHATLNGSRTTDADQVWIDDAPCVARLKEAGAVIVGKTTLPEFGWKPLTDSPLTGITRNPWNPGRTPGGSTGGGAAALSAGVGAIAIGNDGGGSIRIPASYCGLYGIKPSFGRVPHCPQDSATSSHVSDGPITRSVADAAVALNVLSKPDPRDWYALPYDPRDYRVGLEDGVKGFRVGFSADLGEADIAPEVLAIVREAAQRFVDLGAALVQAGPVAPPRQPAFEPYWLAAFAAAQRKIPREKHALLDPKLRELGERGRAVPIDGFMNGIVERAKLGATFNEFFRTHDLLVTPSLPTEAPPVETVYHSPGFDRFRHGVPFTLPFNLTGLPAASLPCGVTSSGLPVGLQIVGPAHDDARVLRASRALETALAFPRLHPRLKQSLDAFAKAVRA
jgi:aspartyl-tRNA(Asn)/glutamyl-tRNA(Gln) amidotransferase subunit A